MRGPIEAHLDGETLRRAPVAGGEVEPVGLGGVARRPLDDQREQPDREEHDEAPDDP
jgi:hypothetical protein